MASDGSLVRQKTFRSFSFDLKLFVVNCQKIVKPLVLSFHAQSKQLSLRCVVSVEILCSGVQSQTCCIYCVLTDCIYCPLLSDCTGSETSRETDRHVSALTGHLATLSPLPEGEMMGRRRIILSQSLARPD